MKDRYKIAMVAACPFPYNRGTPIRIYRLAEALARRGNDVHVVTYHLGNPSNGSTFKIHRIREIKTYQKYSPGPNFQKLLLLDPLLLIKLQKVLKENDVDIIHAHNYEGLIVSLLVRKNFKKPVIYDAHTLLESELPYYKLGLTKKIKKIIGLQIDRRLPLKADHIITVTDRIKNKLIEDAGIFPQKITTIMNGVEAEHFSPNRNSNNAFQNDNKILIFTGNLALYQRIDLLLEVFQKVLQKRPDVRLLIISDSPFDLYESLAVKLNIRSKIDILSSDFDKLPKYLAKAAVALNPRIDCDGFPQKLLNYMAAAKPIVSFESSGRFLKNGVNGLVVEDGNTNAFSDAVLELLENKILAKCLGDNANQFIISAYSWDHAAEMTENVYQQVLTEISK